MGDDEKMFKIGLWTLFGVLLLTVGLQVCYRTQNRTRNAINNNINVTERKIESEQRRFEIFTRPEFLQDKVMAMNPHSEIVGFSKTVSINDLEYNK